MRLFLLVTFVAILFSQCSKDNSIEEAIEEVKVRYKDEIYQNNRRINNVPYGRELTSYGVLQRMVYDVYLPPFKDSVFDRPAVMLAHGGGYINFLDQKSPDIVKIAEGLAKRGYVVFSVEYREEQTALSLFDEKNMILAVARSLIDIRNATCKIMDTTINHGNPFGVDPNKVFVGGVSAGAVSFLHAVFLDSLSWMPPQYQEWILELEPNTQALLDDKYCGASLLGVLNISGAILDTAWIKASKRHEYPAILSVHGTADGIVPYKHRYPFDIKTLPKLFGSYYVDKRAQNIGIKSELEEWRGYGHVPFIGINLSAIFSNNLLDIAFDQKRFDVTFNHTVDFFYELLQNN